MSVEQDIRTAIEEKRFLSFTYSQHPRTVEPHVLGIIDGKRQLLAYQLGGSSSSGSPLPEWRKFDLPEITDLVILDESFPGARPTPAGRHVEYDRVLAVVQEGWL